MAKDEPLAKRRLVVDLPDGQRQFVPSPEQSKLSVTQALRQQGVPLNTRCGEKNMCAGCVIELAEGSLEPMAEETRLAASPETKEIRACQYRLGEGFARIVVPQRALLAYPPQIVDTYRTNITASNDPLVAEGLGVAIDVGTTTVVAQIVEPASGKVLGTASAFNRQMDYGDDVLTRINLCSVDPAMIGTLQRAVVEQTIDPLIAEALATAGRRSDEVRALTVSGNTTMLHLLCGEDPSSLGIAPFTPRFLEKPPFPAERIGLKLTRASVHLLPCGAAYVGADLMAGAIASGLFYEEGPSMLVDVGTNGEILLKLGESFSGCATAAGPAFEGSGLACGIRAGEGAIAHFRVGTDIEHELIGPKRLRPTGICGSAYVDFLAEARRVGWLSPFGRFVPEAMRDRLEEYPGHGKSLKVGVGQGKRPIFICEADVARLLQAKAAIAAGILTLLKRFSLQPRDVKRLHLAGGFGMHLSMDHALACGLLPGFEEGQIELVGNTSLAGAMLALVDKGLLGEMSRCRRTFQAVELNLEPDFEETYIDQLVLP